MDPGHKTVAGLVVRDCVAARIHADVAWVGGFVDGGAEGAGIQDALCRATGFALLGPSCIGIIDTHAAVIASFAAMMLGFDKQRVPKAGDRCMAAGD